MLASTHLTTMSRIVLCAMLFFISCSDETNTYPPDVDFSEGPVVTIASTTQVGILNDHLTDGVSAIDKAYAVRSESHDFAHYIAAVVADDQLGLWFMHDGMDVPGEGFAVNETAQDVSTLPPMQDYDPEQSHEVEVLVNFMKVLAESRR